MSATDHILASLNEEQKRAVTFGTGPLLVLAGAGSGKTRVLVHRIAYLIAQGASPAQFLAVTFTNKAAGEMRERIRRLVNADVWVSTFHASALRMLKQEAARTGSGGDFVIYDDSDQRTLLKECLTELKLDERQFNPKMLQERISRAKDHLLTPERFSEQAGGYYEELIARIYTLYEKKLRDYHAHDFGGLIASCVELLRTTEAVRHYYQQRFQYVLIDEYQDTNHAQYQWVKLLVGAHRNLTVVGDPDQSIYGWRGADIGNILSFEHDFPNTTVIKLERNYRSTKTILDASNALIARNESRKDKALWTEGDEGEPMYLYEAQDERDEADYLVRMTQALEREGVALDDIVVFYRVHAQSRVLEDHLRRANVPYRIVGGVRFYDRKEIKDLIAYLRVIAFPGDEISLRRIINVPARGVGEKALDVLSAWRDEHRVTLFEACGAADTIKGLSKRVRESLHRLHASLQELRGEMASLPPHHMAAAVLDHTRYIDFLETEKTIEAQSRIENIKEFMGAIAEFEEEARRRGERLLLPAFLDMISLQTAVDDARDASGALTLMTIHCAKGLEFKAVFIVGMEEYLFPHANVLDGSSTELEEERRLCYVGITRAKEKVFLSYATARRLYGNRTFSMPSRFIGELPRHLLEFLPSRVVKPRTRGFGHLGRDEEVVEYDVF